MGQIGLKLFQNFVEGATAAGSGGKGGKAGDAA
jgi:hypothetical protein